MIVLVSNSRDFATDYVVAELRQRSEKYCRIDLDLIATDSVTLDPVHQRLTIQSTFGNSSIDGDELRAVLYRAPTFLRESTTGRLQAHEMLARHQWAAFARSLVVFDRATWVNHPQRTYLAENKSFQLLVANRIGFRVPETLIGNCPPPASWPAGKLSDHLAVKALDSFLLHSGSDDLFFFTQLVARSDLTVESLRDIPITTQEFLEQKIDIRVTVVGKRVFAAAIVSNGVEVEGDWRLLKEQVAFKRHALPDDVENKCVALTEKLGLVFGAIDLVQIGTNYWFLEINPTGEWAWLVDDLGFPIPEALADALCKT